MSSTDEQKQDENTPKVNTDRELYREPAETEGMSHYSNSVHVTKNGSIGMNVGGYVIAMPIADWHALAKPPQVEDTSLAVDDYEIMAIFGANQLEQRALKFNNPKKQMQFEIVKHLLAKQQAKLPTTPVKEKLQ